MSREVEKIALILSCNYYGQNILYGAISSALDIAEYLQKDMGFINDNIDNLFTIHMTRENMIKTLSQTADKTHSIARKGKIPSLVFYYNGYTFSSQDSISFVPFDFQSKQIINHTVFTEVFVNRLHPSTELLFIYDAVCDNKFIPNYSNLFVKLKHIDIINIHEKNENGIIKNLIEHIKSRKLNKIISYKNVDVFDWLDVKNKQFSYKDINQKKGKLFNILNKFF